VVAQLLIFTEVLATAALFGLAFLLLLAAVRTLVVALAGLCVGSLLPARPAFAQSTPVTLEASRTTITLGDDVAPSGDATLEVLRVHEALEELAAAERAPWRDEHAQRPYVLLSQPSLFDPTRAPPGKHTAWAYCHVPNGSTEDMTGRIEDQIERFAPGFRDLIAGRHVFTPPGLEASNANLIGGDIGGGTSQLHQQLVFRPIPGFARAETPIRGLYLASASAHPGGGVHGACGANAARAAIAHDRLAGRALVIGGGLAAAAAVRRMTRRKRALMP